MIGADGADKLTASGRYGRVAEWFKALVLKTSDGASRPWVRIPPLPPTVDQLKKVEPPELRSGLHVPQTGHH